MRININYKKYFNLLKATNNLKNHYLIESDFLSSKKMIFDILKILICKKNSFCDLNCNYCNLIEKQDLNYFFIFDIQKKEQTEEVKKLINWVSLNNDLNKSYFWIPNCELLTISSSNKLLKFLEETQENVIGFFTTKLKEKITPTIFSRLVYLNFINRKTLDIFENDNKKILKEIDFNFQNYSDDEINNWFLNLNILINDFFYNVENNKIEKFLIYEKEDFLLKNFWIFIEILIIKIEKLKTINLKLKKILKILMKMLSINKNLNKISKNNLSTKVNLIKLIENIKKIS